MPPESARADLPGRGRPRLGCLLALLAVAGGCGAGLLALVPGKGPPILSALPSGDLLAVVEDADSLWRLLESSERFARFKEGKVSRSLKSSAVWRELARALEPASSAGLLDRSRASHLVGREAGLSATLPREGNRASWIAAFRIDTAARVAELLARRFVLRGRLRLSEEEGVLIATMAGAAARPDGGSISWARMGDLLIASESEEALRRSVRSALAGGEAADARARFGLAALGSRPEGFRASARLERPWELISSALGLSARERAELEGIARALAFPAPADGVAVSFELRGGELLEESFVAGPVPVPGSGEAFAVRPAGSFLWWSFRPGRDEAVARLAGILRGLLPGGSAHELELLRGSLRSRLGAEVAVALAEQPGVETESGGFPAEFVFFRLAGAQGLSGTLEELLRGRSLGVFAEGDALPTEYPYLLRHALPGGALAYEMVIRDARRHEGYRPALSVRGDELVYSSSLDALEAFLAGEGTSPGDRADAWLALDGARVLALDWRTPSDTRPLRNAYEYVVELRRFAGARASELLRDDTDYAGLWTAIEDFLRELREQTRVGVREAGGLRMRARWRFAP